MSVMEPWDGLKIVFERRHIAAFFASPHRVLSSCRVFGGQREDLECVCNHQICEPRGHMGRIPDSACDDPPAYLAGVAAEFGLPGRTALLTTAANVQCGGRGLEEFGKHRVLALVTAGVDGNAARAGDPASYAETDEGIVTLPPPGTINIMLFFNAPLTPGALLDAAVLATEAKVSVLQELSVASCYSTGLATGTGTDSLALAAPLEGRTGGAILTNAGKHAKLGEMLARAVRAALFESLALQNALVPAIRCDAQKLLARFGLTPEVLARTAHEVLEPECAAVLASNTICVTIDPPAVASAAALAHVWDQHAWGVLPRGALDDLLLDYAAVLAASSAGRADLQADYRARLREFMERDPQNWSVGRAAALALCLGFRGKWAEPD